MGYDMYSHPDESQYFRLNIWGMGEYRQIMKDLGMIVVDYEFDDVKDYGDLKEVGRSCEEPGIPLHKFCTNDGWHVTGEECRQALEIYSGYTEKEIREIIDEDDWEYWTEWIAFLRHGAENEGFRVW